MTRLQRFHETRLRRLGALLLNWAWARLRGRRAGRLRPLPPPGIRPRRGRQM